jgi:hypothetical protein
MEVAVVSTDWLVLDSVRVVPTGLCPSFAILKTREHRFSETGSVSILRCGGDIYFVGSLRAGQSMSV